jgi:hypothetical protein
VSTYPMATWKIDESVGMDRCTRRLVAEPTTLLIAVGGLLGVVLSLIR